MIARARDNLELASLTDSVRRQASIRALYNRWLGAEAVRGRRLPATGQARLNLGLTAALFVLAQAGLAIGTVNSQYTLRDPIFQARLNQLIAKHKAHPDRAQVVLLGSSRVLFGVDMDLLEEESLQSGATPVVAANFAHPGGGPITQLIFLRRLLEAGIKPDLVAVEIAPCLFEGVDPEEMEESRLPTTRLTRADLEVTRRYGGGHRRAAETKWWSNWLCPLYAQRLALISQICPSLLGREARQDRSQAFMDLRYAVPAQNMNHWTPTQREQGLEQARKLHFACMQRIPRTGPSVAACAEMLDLCRQRGVPVVLVLMPEGPEIQSWYSEQARADLQALVHALREPDSVPVLNLRAWFPDESWFADSHHFLPKGGVLFTSRLWREGLGPLLERQGVAPLK